MTREQARADIYRHISRHLGVCPLDYIVFSEQMEGDYYSVSFISTNSRHCILASCDDITDPTATALIIKL